MNDSNTTRALIAAHAARYPKAGVQDFMKFLFQSSFGCEHLISDPSAAAEYIRREAANAGCHEGDVIEQLDGAYCRVYLDVLKNGLSADTLAALFARSAEHNPNGAQLLKEKLDVFLNMVSAGELKLNPNEANEMISNWRASGCPACHHSEIFRETYAPAYRVIRSDYAQFIPIFAEIDKHMSSGERFTVAIDGGSASGKTTLSTLIESIYGCTVFHMDDFFLRPEQRTAERYAEPGGNVDRERFVSEVLEPLKSGKPFSYSRFDCGTMSLLPPEMVAPGQLTVVEGSYSLHPYLRSAYQLTVFLRIDPAMQAQRILTRNGAEVAQQYAEKWVPLEKAYYEAFRPDNDCDIVIDIN